MAATDVSICSNALLMLGAQPINSLAENNDRARLASNLYPFVRDYVIRSHPWNCCIKRVTLSPDATAPDFDFAFQFTLPSDWVRTVSVGESGFEDEFRIEGRKLLMDNPICRLRYIFRNEVPATWDDGMVYACTVSMKAVMAYPITQSTSLEQLVDSELQPLLKRQRAVDGMDDTPETMGDSPLLNGRFGGSPVWTR